MRIGVGSIVGFEVWVPILVRYDYVVLEFGLF